MKNILCIHGIGGKERNTDWYNVWREMIARQLQMDASGLTIDFLEFDQLFEDFKGDKIAYARAIKELLSSWISHGEDEVTRGFGFKENLRWSAGMVAQFATDEQLRKKLNELFEKQLAKRDYDFLYAHSLGTLVTYDYLAQQTAKGKNFRFDLLTSGAQIAHPSLRTIFGGQIIMLNVARWINLYNEHDHVFVRPLRFKDSRFMQVFTPFQKAIINHDPLCYMPHINACEEAWPVIARDLSVRSFSSKAIKKTVQKRKPTEKVLLVGINDYPNPEDCLNGCVNDVYRMSEVLQEAGIAPENIRVVLNDRATAKNIRSRMDWLLSDAEAGDFRFFYYSGHGAKIPSSNDEIESDHENECLVCYDFDWTTERAYTDKEFCELYSQLSYGVNFVTMFDCCHSGGMTRDGAVKAKGITPPDDIRHRSIKWDPVRGMWIPRTMKLAEKDLFTRSEKEKAKFTGENLSTFKIGRAVPVWSDSAKIFEERKKKYGHKGPYMPVILEACGEEEYAYEYRHGVTSYGAFTFSVSTALRKMIAANQKVSYSVLMEKVKKILHDLKYDQTPVLVGPEEKLKTPFLKK